MANFTCNRIVKELYPATYNFRDDTIGSAPSSWTVGVAGASTVTVIADWQNHSKVLQLYHDGTNDPYCFKDFTAQTSGTIEFYIGSSDVSNIYYIQLLSGATIAIDTFFTAENYRYWDGASQLICAVTDNTCYHIRIDFECGAGAYKGLAADTFDLYVNGVKEVTGGAFENAVANVSRFRLYPTTNAIDYYYCDAIGLSSDTDYKIGDNAQWRFLKDDADTTSDFESEDWGESGTSIGFVDSATLFNGTLEIDLEFSEHKKILRLQDDVTPGEDPSFYHTETQATAGRREFHIKTNDVSEDWRFGWYENGVDYIVRLRIAAAQLSYLDSVDAWQTIQTVANNTWYHIIVEWYATNTFDVWVNGVLQVDGVATNNNQVSGVDQFIMQGLGDSTDYLYLDAYGDITNDASYQSADNRTWEYKGDTIEDITTSITMCQGTDREYNWGTAYISGIPTLEITTAHIIRILDTDGYLRFEGQYHNQEQYGNSVLYNLHSLNKARLDKLGTYTATAAEDAHATFTALLTDITQAGNDARILFDWAGSDDPADTYTPNYRNMRLKDMMRRTAIQSSKIMIIKPNGVCILDDDKTPRQGAYTITEVSGEVRGPDTIKTIANQINYVTIDGAINPDTGTRFTGVSQDATAQGDGTGILYYYKRMRSLQSNAECAAMATQIRTSGLYSPKLVNIQLANVWATAGEIINYANANKSLTAVDCYVEEANYNFVRGGATYTFNTGILDSSDINQPQWTDADNVDDIQAHRSYELDITTVYPPLTPGGGASHGTSGGIQLNAVNEYAVWSIYVNNYIDSERDIKVIITWVRGDANNDTIDAQFWLYKYGMDEAVETIENGTAISLTECVAGRYEKYEYTLANANIDSDHSYLFYLEMNEAGRDITVRDVTVYYYHKRVS